MSSNETYSKSLQISQRDEEASSRVFWWTALLYAVPLFIAETEWPITLANDDFNVQVNAKVASMQGSVVRQACYLIVLATGLFCLKRVKRHLSSWRSPMSLVYSLLIAWCAISVLWADDLSLSFKRLLAYLFMVVAAVGATALWSHRQILAYLSYTGIAALIFGLVAEIVIGGFKPWYADYRFDGGLHANVQALCCIMLILSAMAAADTDKEHRTRFRLLALAGVSFLVLTKSRSCLMGMTLAFVVYTTLTRSVLAKVWTALTVVTSILTLYMVGALTKVIAFLSRDGEGIDNLTGRKPLWDLADLFLRQRPWTGFGYHSFWTNDHIDFFSNEFGWPIGSAHNSYLEIMLNLGYVGLMLYVAVLVCGIVLSALYYNKTHSPIFAAGSALFVALTLIGMFESAEISSPGPYHFAITLFLGALCFHQKVSSAFARPSLGSVGSSSHGEIDSFVEVCNG